MLLSPKTKSLSISSSVKKERKYKSPEIMLYEVDSLFCMTLESVPLLPSSNLEKGFGVFKPFKTA